MAPAFVSFLHFSLSNKEARDAFKTERGIDVEFLIAKSGPMDRAIDEATGRTRVALIAFADWLAANHWGEEDEEPTHAGGRRG